MKLCVKCNSLVSWNYYFQSYICRECNYRETAKEIKIKQEMNLKENESNE